MLVVDEEKKAFPVKFLGKHRRKIHRQSLRVQVPLHAPEAQVKGLGAPEGIMLDV